MAARSRSDDLEGMRRLNVEQADYYAGERREATGLGRLWRSGRRRLSRLRQELGIKETTDALHRRWLGDLAHSDVLDLGCAAGNRLSVEIATASRSYLGVDLAEPAIAALRTKIASIPGAEARAIDILAMPPRQEFDVVYAISVLHHFRHLEEVLRHLEGHLRPGGRIVCYDPLKTSPPVRLARWLYRPFQEDASWEWPFGTASLRTIGEVFEVVALQGFLGRSKWALALAPLAPRLAARLGRRGHRYDLERARSLGRALRGCMHVTMLLRRRA